MPLSPAMNDALNRQLNLEHSSSHLYLAMSAWAKSQNFSGMSHWLLIQAEEERIHAHKLFQYILDRGGHVRFDSMEAMPEIWLSVDTLVENVLEHEKKVTASIYDISDAALSEKDHGTMTFLQWYVTEQVEEEAAVEDILRQLRLVGDTPSGYFLLDKDLGTRTLSPVMAALRPQ